MFEEYQKIIQDIRQLPDAEKATAQTMAVTYCIAKVVYYIVAGVVVWALGRRIVQASFAAWREARRSSSGS